MKFVSFLYEKKEDYGILVEDSKIIPMSVLLSALELSIPDSLLSFVRTYSDSLNDKIADIFSSHMNSAIDLTDVALSAPIPYPRRNVFCVGKNYADHATELQTLPGITTDIPEYPIYFTKIADPAIGHGAKTVIPKGYTDQFDYEAELAVIIGKDGKDISADQAYDYVFGYSIGNDLSARDVQTRHAQWFKGKSLDATTAIGPYIVSKSELSLPLELDIMCKVNDEIRQSSNTKMLIFDIPTLISDLSKGLTLKAGDIILTGTPAGVGAASNPPRFLKSGDKVECYIEKIGSLVNFVE